MELGVLVVIFIVILLLVDLFRRLGLIPRLQGIGNAILPQVFWVFLLLYLFIVIMDYLLNIL